jgi:hypothetical protein
VIEIELTLRGTFSIVCVKMREEAVGRRVNVEVDKAQILENEAATINLRPFLNLSLKVITTRHLQHNMFKWHVNAAIGRGRPITHDLGRVADGIAASLRQFSISLSRSAEEDGALPLEYPFTERPRRWF